jgi:hypothetical protein
LCVAEQGLASRPRDSILVLTVNIERKMREARRKTNAEAKRARREARRQQKSAVPVAGSAKS